MIEKLLYVALDLKDRQENLSLAKRLAEVGDGFGYKVNADHYYAWGLNYVRELLVEKKPVFVDLKLNNGPRTMTQTIAPLAEAGVSHTNIWSFADKLIRPTVEAIKTIEGSKIEILGVTITSRFDEEYCQRTFGKSLNNTVSYFTKVVLDNGCDGVILPGTCLPAISSIETVKLVAGIRPTGKDKTGLQKQVVTPEEAIANGADILVCGGPIHGAPDPVQALRSILSRMNSID